MIAEIRKPYNYYEGGITWTNSDSCNHLTLGVYTAHTDGKYKLPNSTEIGVELGYVFGLTDLEDCGVTQSDCCEPCVPCTGDLLAWISRPAVYVPQVLAIPEETTETLCILPTSTPIEDIIIQSLTVSIDVSSFFRDNGGEALTFFALGLPPGLAIDPVTGIISGTITDFGTGIYTVTVTALNDCGSTSQTFTITFTE